MLDASSAFPIFWLAPDNNCFYNVSSVTYPEGRGMSYSHVPQCPLAHTGFYFDLQKLACPAASPHFISPSNYLCRTSMTSCIASTNTRTRVRRWGWRHYAKISRE